MVFCAKDLHLSNLRNPFPHCLLPNSGQSYKFLPVFKDINDYGLLLLSRIRLGSKYQQINTTGVYFSHHSRPGSCPPSSDEWLRGMDCFHLAVEIYGAYCPRGHHGSGWQSWKLNYLHESGAESDFHYSNLHSVVLCTAARAPENEV